MHDVIAPQLEAWGSFYVIVGSSAGALTGLQFVVMTLIAQSGPTRSRGETIAAFGTPNVVHFCAALLVAAFITVPWGDLWHAGVAIAACGALGVVYSLVVLRRAHRQDEYTPVFEDWLWHTILPTLSYVLLLGAGVVLTGNAAGALYAIGAAALLLVFVGIHNAWDTVTYVTVGAGAELLGSARREGAAPVAPMATPPAATPGVGPTGPSGER